MGDKHGRQAMVIQIYAYEGRLEATEDMRLLAG